MVSPAGAVVGISVAAYIFAYVGWPAINAIFAANTTGVDTGVKTLGTTVVGIAISLAAVLIFLKTTGLEI